MSLNNVCRLCFSHNGLQMDLFSDIGIELRMVQIITEHFKCEVNEADVFPNAVCQDCWLTTTSFHELYEKSQVARVKFLNSIIKIENEIIEAPNVTNIELISVEMNASEEQLVDESELKKELNPSPEHSNTTDEEAVARDTVAKETFVKRTVPKKELQPSVPKKSKSTARKRIKRNYQARLGELAKRSILHDEGKLSDEYKQFIKENFDMTCDFCDKILESFYDARCHYDEFHFDQLGFVKNGYIKCCRYKLVTVGGIIDHIDTHLKPSRFTCSCHNKVFPSKLSYKIHMKSQTHKYICDICGKAFLKRESIIMHFHRVHVDSDLKFECNICHKRFKHENLLRNHTSYHRIEKTKSHICETCGKSFYHRGALERHSLVHMDKSERITTQMQCKLCGEWFKSERSYKYHLEIHTTGAQKCDQCDKQFIHKHALANHIRRMHGERKHKCTFCDRIFTNKSAQKKHEENTHTRHMQYPCHFCSKMFTVSKSRHTHISRHHLEEWKKLKEEREKS